MNQLEIHLNKTRVKVNPSQAKPGAASQAERHSGVDGLKDQPGVTYRPVDGKFKPEVYVKHSLPSGVTPLNLLAEKGVSYSLVDAKTQQLVKLQKVVRQGKDLQVFVNGKLVVVLEGFFAEEQTWGSAHEAPPEYVVDSAPVAAKTELLAVLPEPPPEPPPEPLPELGTTETLSFTCWPTTPMPIKLMTPNPTKDIEPVTVVVAGAEDVLASTHESLAPPLLGSTAQVDKLTVSDGSHAQSSHVSACKS